MCNMVFLLFQILTFAKKSYLTQIIVFLINILFLGHFLKLILCFFKAWPLFKT